MKVSLNNLERVHGAIKLLEGAVGSTLGPWGRNVVIEKPFEAPHITKDGVTVAKEVMDSGDRVANMVIDIVKQAALKTGEIAGDGTTTSIVLSKELFEMAAKYPLLQVRKRLPELVDQMKEALGKMARPVDISDEEMLLKVATTSANNDRELAKIITEAITRVGKDGIVSVEESMNETTTIKDLSGIQFERGYVSEYFVTNSRKMTAEFDNPLIAFFEETVSEIQPLAHLLEGAAAKDYPLILIAPDFAPQVTKLVVQNRVRNNFNICLIKAPSFGEQQKSMMMDMCISTGADYIGATTGISVAEVSLNDLGQADSIVVSDNVTTILGGRGDLYGIEERVAQIKAQKKDAKTKQSKSWYNKRLAMLESGIVVIQVGGMNEIDMKERKDRTDDAVFAVKAALEDGVLPGSGSALVKAADTVHVTGLPDPIANSFLHCMDSPMKKIFYNYGHTKGFAGEADMTWEVIREKVKRLGLVPNLLENSFEEEGTTSVIDPKKVVVTALENAASVVLSLISTDAFIHLEEKEVRKEVGSEFDTNVRPGVI